ncbi:TetR family transcriptional regulator [Nocardiopsis sp. TSRI0078]|uniref:TetR/AcrR family transcriptional regulator n=1 Tax=unclassified Nocardiopsis TaxID=2649073 RepID=UPI000939A73A|nr:TetR/AcrR family transcriptional regulator [Nocardiopsis sp. TSRI0078]OKI20400.1 TetR family transcriptional regulator [Nocardiopsis sp. TSRI0078]
MNASTRGPGAEHEQRRRQIADAVLAVTAERGLAAVTQSNVAARAGVSAGRVQHYFPTKREMIEAAFDRGNALSAARIAARVGRAGAPRQVLTTVLTELIPHDAVTRTHLRVRQAFTALALSDEDIAERMRRDYERFHGQVTDLLARGQDAGEVPRELDCRERAVSLVALAEGLAYYVLVGIHSASEARERVLTEIAGTYAPVRGQAMPPLA